MSDYEQKIALSLGSMAMKLLEQELTIEKLKQELAEAGKEVKTE